MARFGSVEWQEEMQNRIDEKLERGEELNDYEQVFLVSGNLPLQPPLI